MSIHLRCPSCDKGLAVPEHMAGKRGKCPACGNLLTVPGAAPQAPPVVAEPSPGIRPVPAAPPIAANAYVEPDRAWPSGSGGKGSRTPPGTFHSLYFTYLMLTVASVVLLSLYFVFALLTVVSMAKSTSERLDYISKKAPDRNWDRRIEFEPPPVPTIPWYAVVMLPLGLLGLAAAIAQIVIFCILLYKEWDLIQDGRARTTPGQAVGFLFIPFFNFYWWFVAIRGLALDLNAYAERRGLNIRPASVGLATAWPIVAFCSIIPLLGSFVLLASMIVGLLAMYSIKNAASDIATAMQEAA